MAKAEGKEKEQCVPAAVEQTGSRKASAETVQEEFNTGSSVRMIVRICKEEPVF